MIRFDQFRKRVIRSSLFAPCGLEAAITRLGFVQADPIRSPARAQDLILRHRVKNYRAGDLERHYPKLDLEECFLYAYGFAPQDLWRAIYPKPSKALTSTQRKTRDLVRRHGPMHPRDLETHIGQQRTRNVWGGFSQTAKLALESLHHRGHLRIARRENGIRVYASAKGFQQTLSKSARCQALMLVSLQTMGPTTRAFLLSELRHFDYLVPHLADRRRCLQALIDTDRIKTETVDSIEYIALNQPATGRTRLDRVRILAPFDPIVRDRKRFEHLWGWTYRFEAYTPKAKRKLGYYAMPVLWGDQIIGWANASVEDHRLRVDFGYTDQRPAPPAYRKAAEAEVNRLATFLGLTDKDWQASV